MRCGSCESTVVIARLLHLAQPTGGGTPSDGRAVFCGSAWRRTAGDGEGDELNFGAGRFAQALLFESSSAVPATAAQTANLELDSQ